MERQHLFRVGDQNRWPAVLNCTLPDPLICTNRNDNLTMEDVNSNLESPQGTPVMLSGCTMTIKNGIFLRHRGLCRPILVLTISANGQWGFANYCFESNQNDREPCPAHISPRQILALRSHCRVLPSSASHFGAEVSLDASNGLEVSSPTGTKSCSFHAPVRGP
jgi:hypothetical protein